MGWEWIDWDRNGGEWSLVVYWILREVGREVLKGWHTALPCWIGMRNAHEYHEECLSLRLPK